MSRRYTQNYIKNPSCEGGRESYLLSSSGPYPNTALNST